MQRTKPCAPASRNHSRLARVAPILRLVAFAALVAVTAPGCAAEPPLEDESGVVSSEDAITGDELSAGAGWDGHDELSDDEEAALGATSGPDDDLSPSDLEPGASGIRPLAGGCAAATGYSKGKAMKICTTTINGKAVEVKTAQAFARMRDAAKRAGVNIVVVSGFRTMAKQRELYKAYKAGRGNLAAPPGFSNHQSGHALDLNAKAPGVYKWLANNAPRFGFRRTVPSENWHWEHW